MHSTYDKVKYSSCYKVLFYFNSKFVLISLLKVRPSNIQGQQEFIQMNGQTLMVPCATAQNITAAASSAQNLQNTTLVQQNTTIVQQQTTMVSNNQLPGFQASNSNATPAIEHPTVNIEPAQQFILNAGMLTVIHFFFFLL